MVQRPRQAQYRSLIDEHRDRTFDDAAHLKHLLEHVAAGIFQVDQNDVGVDGVDAREQVRGLADPNDLRESGFAQAIFQNGGADRIFVDDDNIEIRRRIHDVHTAKTRRLRPERMALNDAADPVLDILPEWWLIVLPWRNLPR
jgi:hypothetical protein